MTMIQTVTSDHLFKAFQVTTYVPIVYLADVITSILKVSPINFGNYENVIWTSSVGKEQFKPKSGASPQTGVIGQLEKVDSVAMSFFIPRDKNLLLRIINKGIFPAHPWEEPVVKAEKCLVPTNI